MDLRPALPSGLLSHQQRGEEKQSLGLYLAAGVCSPELRLGVEIIATLTGGGGTSVFVFLWWLLKLSIFPVFIGYL